MHPCAYHPGGVSRFRDSFERIERDLLDHLPFLPSYLSTLSTIYNDGKRCRRKFSDPKKVSRQRKTYSKYKLDNSLVATLQDQERKVTEEKETRSGESTQNRKGSTHRLPGILPIDIEETTTRLLLQHLESSLSPTNTSVYLNYLCNRILRLHYSDLFRVNRISLRPIAMKERICSRHLVKAVENYIFSEREHVVYLEMVCSKLSYMKTGKETLDLMIEFLARSEYLPEIVFVVSYEGSPDKSTEVLTASIPLPSYEYYLEKMDKRKLFLSYLMKAYRTHYNCMWCHVTYFGCALHAINYGKGTDSPFPKLMNIMNSQPIDFATPQEIMQALFQILGSPESATEVYKATMESFWIFSGEDCEKYHSSISQAEHRLVRFYLQSVRNKERTKDPVDDTGTESFWELKDYPLIQILSSIDTDKVRVEEEMKIDT